MQSTDGRNDFRKTERWNSVPVPDRVALRAYENVDKREDGCWISRYSVASHGYSQIGWQESGNRHVVLGHRAAWVHAHGQLPLGVTIDHTCKERRCVNPSHLRLLPNFENARRINGADFPLGGCRLGHPNTSLRPVKRQTKSGDPRMGWTCGDCTRVSRAAWIERNREQHLAIQRASSRKRRAAARAATDGIDQKETA